MLVEMRVSKVINPDLENVQDVVAELEEFGYTVDVMDLEVDEVSLDTHESFLAFGARE